MGHYLIIKENGFWRIKERGLFRYYDYNSVLYDTVENALEYLEKELDGLHSIIKIVE